jgi:hypothetical protein
MGSLPLAEVFAVQLYGDGPPQCLGHVTVRCPYCQTLHAHRVFATDTVVFARTAPCSAGTSVRRYRVDLNPQGPNRDVSLAHPVYAAGESLNDNAIDVPVPNWEE